jgi:hypothetical protein
LTSSFRGDSTRVDSERRGGRKEEGGNPPSSDLLLSLTPPPSPSNFLYPSIDGRVGHQTPTETPSSFIVFCSKSFFFSREILRLRDCGGAGSIQLRIIISSLHPLSIRLSYCIKKLLLPLMVSILPNSSQFLLQASMFQISTI